uniref:Uncharacterized protein n=1 Tax=Mycena chlorophos TaxID=658473 RepID=A0ABQ0KTX6_MYCCL|nr:predicted protein [Mycena chlorophos]
MAPSPGLSPIHSLAPIAPHRRLSHAQHLRASIFPCASSATTSAPNCRVPTTRAVEYTLSTTANSKNGWVVPSCRSQTPTRRGSGTDNPPRSRREGAGDEPDYKQVIGRLSWSAFWTIRSRYEMRAGAGHESVHNKLLGAQFKNSEGPACLWSPSETRTLSQRLETSVNEDQAIRCPWSPCKMLVDAGRPLEMRLDDAKKLQRPSPTLCVSDVPNSFRRGPTFLDACKPALGYASPRAFAKKLDLQVADSWFRARTRGLSFTEARLPLRFQHSQRCPSRAHEHHQLRACYHQPLLDSMQDMRIVKYATTNRQRLA